MASPNLLNVGGSTGDRLTQGSLYVANNGFTWYVGNTVSGAADAAATGGALDGGRRREKPLLTLAQAITNCADGDTITLLSGHAETLAAAQTINKKVTIASEGDTDSQRARFTCSGAVAMFDITVANVRLRNIYFPASTAVPTARVRIATAGCQVVDCYFECGASDTSRALSFVTGASQCRVSGTSFVSVAATPAIGLEVINAMTGLDLEDVTFDGGAFGWTSYAFQGTAAITNASFMGVNLVNQSDLHWATGSTGFLQVGDVSGGSVVRIDA